MTAPHDTLAPVILSIAYPYAPIGSNAVGGAEVILSQIEAALPSLGLQSVVVAHAGSQPRGRLYPTTVPAGEITEAFRAAVEDSQQQAIDRALAENPVALVHLHGLDFHRYRFPAHLPVLVTLHLPPAWYPESIWSLPPNFHLLCVSETQKQACPESVRDRLDVVPNGVPLPDTSALRPAGRYALMMARICEEKNLHTGLDAARLADMPAMLAGEVFPYEAHQRYFAEQIEPRLNHSGNAHQSRAGEPSPSHADARFLGPVTGAAKSRLLARAACLLLPSLAPETSSLVAMEALAAGVPVIAMASGAVPEIVEHGRTGFLLSPQLGSGAEAAQAMADAIARLPEIDRRLCRSVAEERFGLDRMLQTYRTLYQRYALQGLSPIANINDSKIDLSAAAHTSVPAVATTAALLTTAEQLTALAPAWTRLWNHDPRATPFQHPAW
ncbi:MAG: glycosyltransferase, partial [Janthinobacterium lividum]